MSGKVCECGEILKNTIYPNDLEWNIYDKKKLQMYEKMNFFKYIEEQDVLDYFWLCPKCKRCHVWLNENKKHEEFRIYEYRKNENRERINIKDMKEICVFSAKDEDNFKEKTTVKDIINLHMHNHRYLVTPQEDIVYLYNTKNDTVEEKYIIAYSTNNQFDIEVTESGTLE